jgi:hypothetical protein
MAYMRYANCFNDRHAVETRIDGLFVGDLRIYTAGAPDENGAPLTNEVRDALRLFDHARLHRCSGCGSAFIAHHAARLCSAECRKAALAFSQAKATKKRIELTAWTRAHREGECLHCGSGLNGSARRTRRFCSAACRQAAYRARSICSPPLSPDAARG